MKPRKPKASLMAKKRKELEEMAAKMEAMEKIDNELVKSETNIYLLIEMLLEQGIKFSEIDMDALAAMIAEKIDFLKTKKKKSVSQADDGSPDEASNESDAYSAGI